MSRTALLLAVLAVACCIPGVLVAAEPLAASVAEIRAQLRGGDADAAVAAAERAVADLADDAQAWWWAGQAYGLMAMRAGLLGKAKWAGRTREAFERAVALDPDHLDARFGLIDFYLLAPGLLGGSEDKARAQVAEISVRNASLGKFGEARLALADEEQAQAVALLEQSLVLDPDNLRARSALASLSARDGDWARVRALWESQLVGTRQRAVARYQLGRAAAISGEALEQGLAQLQQFIAAGEVPEDLSLPAAHWRRGQILEKLGRRDEAVAALELARNDPSVGELATADLERLGADE